MLAAPMLSFGKHENVSARKNKAIFNIELIMIKKKIRSYFLSIIPLFCLSSASGYFYRADYWPKGNHHLILLSDCHFAQPKKLEYYRCKAQEQREDLFEFLKATDSFVIVEDLDGLTLQIPGEVEAFLEDPFHFNPNRNLGLSLDCLFCHLQPFESPLISFTQCCHTLKIPVINVDFRYFTIDFLQDHLTGNDIYNLGKKTVEEIASYHDTQALRKIYQKKLSKFNSTLYSCKPFYNRLSQTKSPITRALRCARYDSSLDPVVNRISYKLHRFFSCKKRSALQASDEIKRLKACDKKRMVVDDLYDELLDLKILHQIHKHRKHKFIVVLAGGAHIHHIEKYLPQLGYRKTASFGANASMKKASPAINLGNLSHIFLNKNSKSIKHS